MAKERERRGRVSERDSRLVGGTPTVTGAGADGKKERQKMLPKAPSLPSSVRVHMHAKVFGNPFGSKGERGEEGDTRSVGRFRSC